MLGWVGIDVPGTLELRPGPDAMRDGSAHDLFADGTMVAHASNGDDESRAFVLEVQLREDLRKYLTWAYYVIVTRRRLGCPVTLLVFTDDEDVARWAERPIDVSPGLVLSPTVIGPSNIPRDLTLELSRNVPALAVLAVVGHGRGSDAERLGRMALEVTRPMFARGEDHARLYVDVIFAYLDRAVLQKVLEDEMNLQTYEPISDFLKEHIARGRTEGRTEGLREGTVRLLERRGLEPSAEQRQRLAACTDVAQLKRWFDRAVMAKTVAEVFDL
ncbi:MAG: hypothetical protein AB1Z98_18400 [Nannocystaceae bacterium]